MPVSQRGDHQTVCAAQVLVLIDEVHVGDGHDDSVLVLLKVKSALLQPFKVIDRSDILLDLWGTAVC